MLRYVEPLSDARTPLAGFLSTLQDVRYDFCRALANASAIAPIGWGIRAA